MLGAGLGHTFQRVVADERRVAEHDDGVTLETRQSVACLHRGVACAKLFFLQHDGCLWIIVLRGFGHQIGTVACHNHNLFRFKAVSGFQDVGQHRRACDLVQYLGKVRFHACAFACRKDDQSNIHQINSLSLGRGRFNRFSHGDKSSHLTERDRL